MLRLCSLLSVLPPSPDSLSREAMIKVPHTALSPVIPQHNPASLWQSTSMHDSTTHMYLAPSLLPLLSFPHLPLLGQKHLHFSNCILMLHVHCHSERSHCHHNHPHHPLTNSLNKSLHQNDTQGNTSWRFQMNAMATFLLEREKSAFFSLFFFLFCLFFFKPPSSFSLTCLPPLSRKWEQGKIKGGIKNAIANKYCEISHCTASL